MSDVFDHLADLLTPYSVRIRPVSEQYPDLLDRLIARADELGGDLTIERRDGQWVVVLGDCDEGCFLMSHTFEEAARKALAKPLEDTTRK